MGARLRSESGFLMVELMTAVLIITIAVLGLVAAYSQSFFSLRHSAKSSAAGQLAENQLELYASLSYASIGLDATTLTSTKSSDTYYSPDESALPGSGSDVTISGCGASAKCSPVQTLTGSDGKSYKLETFIRSLTNNSASSWTEKVVTVIVRDPSKSGYPKVITAQTAFDHGP